MVIFKGHSTFKQYMPLKPTTRGHKIWIRADALTGYRTHYTGRLRGYWSTTAVLHSKHHLRISRDAVRHILSGQKAYMKEGQEKEVKITTKAMKTVDESEAVATFFCITKSFKKYCFTMCKQFAAFRECKGNVSEDKCIVHVDFSENFNCKYHSEIQVVHFGASHKQASLHNVVIYVKNEPPLCMCTISANLIHGPIGISAHLNPVLTDITRSSATA